MKRTLSLLAAALAASACGPSVVAAQGMARLPCVRTAVARIALPTGPAQYQSGTLALRNRATLRVQGSQADLAQVRAMNVGDPVVACYGPPKTYADAGPSRTTTVLDLASGAFYGALVGYWPRR